MMHITTHIHIHHVDEPIAMKYLTSNLTSKTLDWNTGKTFKGVAAKFKVGLNL